MDETLECNHDMVLFIMLYKVVLTFKSVNQTLPVCDQSDEGYWALLSCGTVLYYAVQGGSNV